MYWDGWCAACGSRSLKFRGKNVTGGRPAQASSAPPLICADGGGSFCSPGPVGQLGEAACGWSPRRNRWPDLPCVNHKVVAQSHLISAFEGRGHGLSRQYQPKRTGSVASAVAIAIEVAIQFFFLGCVIPASRRSIFAGYDERGRRGHVRWCESAADAEQRPHVVLASNAILRLHRGALEIGLASSADERLNLEPDYGRSASCSGVCG